LNTFKTLGLLAYNGGLHVHSFLLTIVPHDSFPFYLLTITQGERQATCVIKSSEMCGFDQTARCLLGILQLTGQVSSTSTLYRE
jgi:hypothetical protein